MPGMTMKKIGLKKKPNAEAEDYNEASYPAFEGDTTSGYPQMDPAEDGKGFEDYEVTEEKAIALNCLEELDESSEA